MIDGTAACPRCGATAAGKDGLDRRGGQAYRCRDCRHRFTARNTTPFSGYRFPPEITALAVRWCSRYRLSFADVAELLAERGIRVDASSIDAWVQEFAPLYKAAARAFRRAVGGHWSVNSRLWTRPGIPRSFRDGQCTASRRSCFGHRSGLRGAVH